MLVEHLCLRRSSFPVVILAYKKIGLLRQWHKIMCLSVIVSLKYF